MAENKIKVFLIFEMLGRPVEHLKNTLSDFIAKLGKEIHEPKRVEESKQEIYTTFTEVEIEFKDMPSLYKIVFTYMPSHIEIVEPEELRIKNFDLNLLMNELIRRLHQYDEIVKGLAIERGIMQQQLQQAGIQPAIPMHPVQSAQRQQKEETKKKTSKKTRSKKRK